MRPCLPTSWWLLTSWWLFDQRWWVLTKTHCDSWRLWGAANSWWMFDQLGGVCAADLRAAGGPAAPLTWVGVPSASVEL